MPALQPEADCSIHRSEEQYSALRLYPRADGLPRAELHRFRRACGSTTPLKMLYSEWWAWRGEGGRSRRRRKPLIDAIRRATPCFAIWKRRATQPRQYDATDPENRLVAGELETRWNQALARLAEIETRIADH